jgi:hypothetical protein
MKSRLSNPGMRSVKTGQRRSKNAGLYIFLRGVFIKVLFDLFGTVFINGNLTIQDFDGANYTGPFRATCGALSQSENEGFLLLHGEDLPYK